jgi:hypothetical protein
MYYNQFQVSYRAVVLLRTDCPRVFEYIIEAVLNVQVFWDVKCCRWGNNYCFMKNRNAFIFRVILRNNDTA